MANIPGQCFWTKRIPKLRLTEDSKYVFQNELDKVCSQHDMAFSDFKNLSMRTKYIEHDEYYGYQRGLASVVYNF